MKLKIFILAIIALSAQASIVEFEQKCVQFAGGESSYRAGEAHPICTCPKSGLIQINPDYQQCPDKALKDGYSFLYGEANQIDTCPFLQSDIPVKEVTLLNRDSFCKKPGMYLCDDQYNEFVYHAEIKNKKLEAIMQRIDKNAECIVDFSMASLKKCAEIKARMLYPKLFSNTTTNDEAAKIFEKAKQDAIRHLYRYEQYGYDQEGIESMVQNLKNTTIDLHPTKSEDILHGAHYDNSESGGGTVHPGTDMLYLPENPIGFYRTMLHELAHAIDPRYFLADPVNDLKQFVFADEVQCLMLPESVGASDGDLPCWREMREQYIQEGKDTRKIDLILKDLAHAPTIQTDEQSGNRCHNYQLGEAFADWFSTDVIAETSFLGNDMPFTNLPKNISDQAYAQIIQNSPVLNELKSIVAKFCTMGEEAENQDTLTSSSVKPEIHFSQNLAERKKLRMNNIDTHPLNEDRINGIVLQNPKFMEALGCDPAVYQSNYFDQPKASVNRVVSESPKSGYISCFRNK